MDKTEVANNFHPELVRELCGGIAGLMVLALLLAALLMWRSSAVPDQIIKVFGVIFVVGLSTVLLIAGYSSEQLTPVIGLFGAIVGYLLGKNSGASTGEH